MKIAVAGIGYVGLALATLLSEKNKVVAYDVDAEKVEKVNNYISPIRDKYIEKYFEEAKNKKRKLHLKATLDSKEALSGADYVIIATPTDYDIDKKYFDTKTVENVIKEIVSLKDPGISIVIKSTVPVGFVKKMRKKYKYDDMFFSPEFLREGRALYDNLYPTRIVVGSFSKSAEKFAKLLSEAALKKDVKVLMMDEDEAEAVKLFSNTFLALRVAYFNELDTYAKIKGMDTKNIVEGVCLDPRIGGYYNNPSFGYGGLCLPKDTKQLLANYRGVPQEIIRATVKANATRKKFVVDDVLKKNPETVGIYRLVMKAGSDNFRDAAIGDIIKVFKQKKKNMLIYEPIFDGDELDGIEVTHDLKYFKEKSTVIVANRRAKELDSVEEKVYTRDLFSRD
ncbi:nucleotide sugar dehydrogenase [Candidatus Saccharibacteria bacterium]|nr:nucleotide sugar dehydrogenase [Candidatus Saccharibacteria bacterium]